MQIIFPCAKCGKFVSFNASLDQPLKSAIGPLFCAHCGMPYGFVRDVIDGHNGFMIIAAITSKITPYACRQCGEPNDIGEMPNVGAFVCEHGSLFLFENEGHACLKCGTIQPGSAIPGLAPMWERDLIRT